MLATVKVGFSLIGGGHQLPHILPVAANLSRRPGVRVALFAPDLTQFRAAHELFRRLGGAAEAEWVILLLPELLEPFAELPAGRGALKPARLLCWAKEMRNCNVLVTAERTSTLLRRLPGRCPPLVHIPHGAGDRARGFERRIARFDHVIVAGPKDRARMVSSGLVRADRCHISGYVKHAALVALNGDARPKLFQNDRPVVLYNAHFEPRLSSWRACADQVIDSIVADGRFNLIVAPHVRLFEGAGAARLARWSAKAVPDRVLIDLGSSRSVDMTYTRAADIYLGDVSSQVYEFAIAPRPCVFLNMHGAAWRDNPDYLMWRMGDVVEDCGALVSMLARAPHRHDAYRAAQDRLTQEALGDASGDPVERAADLVLACRRQR